MLKVNLGIRVNFAEFSLQQLWVRARITADFSEPGEQPDGLNYFFFLKRNHSTCPGTLWDRNSCVAGSCGSIRNAANRRSTGFSARLGAFRCGDQLQQLLWIIEPLFELRTQSLCRNLRCYAYFTRGRIRSDEFDLVNPDGCVLVVTESLLDVLDDVLSF